MAIRIGQYIFGPNILVLPFAAAFFFILTRRGLAASENSNRAIWTTQFFAVIFGVAGAWLHAATFPVDDAYKMQFGLLGGFWGVMTGVALAAAIQGRPILSHLDAITPGLLVAGAIARIGCLFAGCCNGRFCQIFGTLQPFRHWPLFDIAALLLTALAIFKKEASSSSKPGCVTAEFLILYGAFRFVLEFARDVPKIFGPLSSAQLLIIIQAIIGALILIKVSHEKDKSILAP